MRVFVIGFLVLGTLYLFKPGAIHITPDDIKSVSTPIEQQKRSILLYLRELECKGHSPCFYAIVDGALARDAKGAISKCRDCETRLNILTVPTGLPDKVTTLLQQAQDQHRMNVQRFRYQAEDYVAASQGRRIPRRRREPDTCSVFAIVDKINKAYGLDKMMNGKYVDCAVLANVK